MPTPTDPPRVAVEVTRDELTVMAGRHYELIEFFGRMGKHDRAAYHRAREAELRKILEESFRA